METMYTYTFDEKETLIFAGLKVYITGCLGEYLDESQIDSLAQILRKFRKRPAEVEFAENYCVPLTKDNILRNRYIPRKTLRKDECAVFFYNLSPYALLNRLQTARFAKLMLPNFFAAEQTINSVFTRFANSSSDDGFTIENLPYHSTTHLEKFLFELGLKNNHKNNERK